MPFLNWYSFYLIEEVSLIWLITYLILFIVAAFEVSCQKASYFTLLIQDCRVYCNQADEAREYNRLSLLLFFKSPVAKSEERRLY